MIHASIPQILYVWHGLERALQGTNTYAGDEAEVYCYQLMPRNPLLDGHLAAILQKPTDSWYPEAVTAVETFKQDLFDLCQEFQKLTGAVVTIEGLTLEDFLRGENLYTHRVHIKVKEKDNA